MIKLFSLIVATVVSVTALAEIPMPSLGHGHHGGSTLKLGRYVGQISVDDEDKSIFSTLDLVVVQEGGDYPYLKAVLKTYLGDFLSQEYMSYVYDKIFFDPQSESLTFDFAGQDLVLTNVRYHGDHLMGEVWSSNSLKSAKLHLKFQRDFDSSSPVLDEKIKLMKSNVERLSGEYIGKCEGKDAKLQIETYRTQSETRHYSHSFGQYQIRGRLTSDLVQLRKNAIFHAGAYNHFSGELFLYGRPGNFSCKVKGKIIDCGQCLFDKLSGLESFFPGKASADYFSSQVIFQADQFEDLGHKPDANDLTGVYYGYLFHENHNFYQAIRVDVVGFRDRELMGSPNELQFASSATLFFGDFTSGERINMRFEPRPYRVSGGSLLLHGDTESFAIVRTWVKGAMKIDWYSNNYGRVGSVVLLKGKQPKLPAGTKVMAPISGSYSSGRFEFNLTAGPEGESEEQPYNTFHPLSVFGAVVLSGVGQIYPIESGSFDFYSGYFWFESNEEARYLGHRGPDGSTHLFFTGNELLFGPSYLPYDFVKLKVK